MPLSLCSSGGYEYGYGYSRYGVNHIESHFDGTMGVIRPGLWQPGDTIITIAQQLNAQTMVLCGQSIKSATEKKGNENKSPRKENRKALVLNNNT